MPKRLRFKNVKVSFPAVCFVCQQPAGERYDVSRVFYLGNRSVNVTVPMPLCADHFAVASTKSPTEKLLGRIGLVLGAVVGLALAIGLVAYWRSSDEGSLLMHLALGSFMGLGAFLVVWSLQTFVVAPIFASPQSKAARNALKIARYWHNTGQIELEFANEKVAEMISHSNRDDLLREA
jgi:hypothetical protein